MGTLDNKLINLRGLKHTYNKILDKTVVVFNMSNYMSGNCDYDSLSGLTEADIAIAKYNGQKLSSTSINVGRDQFVITWISNDVVGGGLNYFTTKGELKNGIYSITTEDKDALATNDSLEALSQEITGSIGLALDNIYTKNEVYTKTESDSKFQPKGNYAASSSVTKTALESTLGMSSYAKASDLTDIRNNIESDVETTLGIKAGETIDGKTVIDLLDEWNAFKSGTNNTQDVIDTLTEIQNYISSDIESFAKLSETVNTTSNTVNNTIPSMYAKKTDLNSYVKTDGLSNTLTSYATKDELNNLTFSVKEATEDDINIIMNSIK